MTNYSLYWISVDSVAILQCHIYWYIKTVFHPNSVIISLFFYLPKYRYVTQYCNVDGHRSHVCVTLFITLFLVVVSKEKVDVIQEEHRAQLERLQQKLTEAENKYSRLQQEKQQQQSQQAIVRSRSPPDLALQRATEERRPGEVRWHSYFHFVTACARHWVLIPFRLQGMDQSELAETDSAPMVSWSRKRFPLTHAGIISRLTLGLSMQLRSMDRRHVRWVQRLLWLNCTIRDLQIRLWLWQTNCASSLFPLPSSPLQLGWCTVLQLGVLRTSLFARSFCQWPVPPTSLCSSR